MTDEGGQRRYPNVKARLRLSRQAPGLPERAGTMDIWLKGTAFHVRDASGRGPTEMLQDLTAERGLGAPVRTMEGIMDVWSEALSGEDPGATDLYGDLAGGEGWVYRRGEDRWAIPISAIAPIAEQILARGQEAGLATIGQVTRAGRSGTEYRGAVEGTVEGARYRNEVTVVLSPPFVLLHDVRDARDGEHHYTREVVSLDEGGVTEAEVTPP